MLYQSNWFDSKFYAFLLLKLLECLFDFRRLPLILEHGCQGISECIYGRLRPSTYCIYKQICANYSLAFFNHNFCKYLKKILLVTQRSPWIFRVLYGTYKDHNLWKNKNLKITMVDWGCVRPRHPCESLLIRHLETENLYIPNRRLNKNKLSSKMTKGNLDSEMITQSNEVYGEIFCEGGMGM